MRVRSIQPNPTIPPVNEQEKIKREINRQGMIPSQKGKEVLSLELEDRVRRQMVEFTDEVLVEFDKLTDFFQKGILLKLHKDTERFFVQVINAETQEVLKEMPPEEFLDLIAKIRNIVGLFLDETA